MAIEKEFFRRAMGHFATGVTVVTTRIQETLAGVTVNAFCSVSLHPPLILICVDLASATYPMIRDSGVFAVNVLTEQQEALSRCFATASAERYEGFCHARYQVAATGAPIIEDTLAFMDARVATEYPGGDHAIFLGQVLAMGVAGQVAFAQEANGERSKIGEHGSNRVEEAPLVYYLGQYRHLSRHYWKPSLPVLTAPVHKEAGTNLTVAAQLRERQD